MVSKNERFEKFKEFYMQQISQNASFSVNFGRFLSSSKANFAGELKISFKNIKFGYNIFVQTKFQAHHQKAEKISVKINVKNTYNDYILSGAD